MCILEDGVIEKYRRIIAYDLWQPEQVVEDLDVPEWTYEDEQEELRNYYAFMVADGGGTDCQRLLETYS